MKNIILGLIILAAFQLQAQECNLSTHSTNRHDSWQTCEVAQNPNPNRGDTHWILYDLGYVYNIGATKFWNYNVYDETDKGIRNFSIDYSQDGINWTETPVFQLAEAPGNSSYAGETGPNLGGVEARYLLITVQSTWGSECAGLSEVRFDVDGLVTVEEADEGEMIRLFPNPAQQRIMVDSDMELQELLIFNSAGQELARMKYRRHIDVSYLPNGLYFLKSVNLTNEIHLNSFIKQGQ